MQLLGVLVADAGEVGLKIIFDHHDNDGGPGGWGGQQANGLWIDSGPGTDGTDGSHTTGTVTAAKFLTDSVAFAKYFAGISTVIGFDLDNEPTSAGNINWGKGGPTDIQAIYTQVGDAVQAVDPGALIIAEGPEEWSGPAPGMPAGFGEGDLSGVASDPVTLNIPNKIVYSVHEYPPDLSGNGYYAPAQQIAAMNKGWGYLETQNIAPVWIGEMGSDMTQASDFAWTQMLLDYMNGKDGAQGGPTFSGNNQPVSGSWWQWGAATGQDPEGVETAWGSGAYWPAQQVATGQLLYHPISVPDMIVSNNSLTMLSAGVQSFNFKDAQAGGSGSTAPVVIGSGSDTLSLFVSEDAYRGNAQFTASIDGTTIGGVQTATASHAAAQSQEFDVKGSFGSGQHQVSINFLNDAYGGSPTTDRNLYVSSSTINVWAISASSLTMMHGGAQSFVFAKPQAGGSGSIVPVVIGSGSDTLVLFVSEDAYQGNAQFTVNVDGAAEGRIQTATASHANGQWQEFDVKGSYGSGAHNVAVDFLNDAYGGSPTTDRNLYVL